MRIFPTPNDHGECTLTFLPMLLKIEGRSRVPGKIPATAALSPLQTRMSPAVVLKFCTAKGAGFAENAASNPSNLGARAHQRRLDVVAIKGPFGKKI